ncbi:MAG: adenosylmethionine--8-amino-7-oxononanoate transaminase [Desulfobacteraceae bacterium]|nr:adenosylmethionine--8-amino-7-oxononanoate transaminase [Desulfobacteraceae bacterium]MBC2755995.1 adenosylmethionine--8-amino-7-oxononanoate transaminase [Desulfobacteraceae bacterium]
MIDFKISKDPKLWRQYDRKHIWHPYTSMLHPLPAYTVSSAHGVCLKLADGRELIDGMSSWWTAIHGYNHPRLNAAIEEQLKSMAHVMFGGLTHQPAIGLAERLVELTAKPLQHVFFCDSGSVSVEVAIKMAIQYWYAQGKTNKQRLLTVRGGYHGDTFGAMSVCDPVNGMHQMFAGVLPQHLFAPRPQRDDGKWDDVWIKDFKELLENNRNEIAAVVIEPIVQGAGGMNIFSAEYLRRFHRLCDENDVLLIFDEIATGFGRTGRLFAYEHADVVPDILCLGKAMTGGYMTLAATLASTRVAEGISADGHGVLMHGPTFMANPLACRVAVESIDLLLESPWQQQVNAIEKQIQKELAPCRQLPGVADVRNIGAIGVVETKIPVEMPWMQEQFVKNGVWIRPFGNLVYIMPPYIIEPEQLSKLTGAIYNVLEEWGQESD